MGGIEHKLHLISNNTGSFFYVKNHILKNSTSEKHKIITNIRKKNNRKAHNAQGNAIAKGLLYIQNCHKMIGTRISVSNCSASIYHDVQHW